MANDSRQQALEYLGQHRVVTLATAGPEGIWAAALFYVNDNFDLIFLSAGHTRHARNLTAQSRAAATIQEDYSSWTAIKGIQLEGTVKQLAGDERIAAMALYQNKYPFIADGPLQAALAGVNWYRLRPARLYFIDNSRGLGYREEIDIML